MSNVSGPFISAVSPLASELASTQSGGADDTSLWSSLLVTALALAFVLVLAWLFLKLLKKATPFRKYGSDLRHIEIVQVTPLGRHERLILVRHDGHELLLGVTNASIHLIDKKTIPRTNLPDPEAATD